MVQVANDGAFRENSSDQNSSQAASSLVLDWNELANDKNFDVSKWIGKLLPGAFTKPTSNEQAAALASAKTQLLMALHLEREKASKELESLTYSFLATGFPSLLLNIGSLKRSITNLHTEVLSVKKEMNKFQSESQGSFEALMKLDKTRQRMTTVRHGLSVLERWRQLSSDCENAFLQNDLEKVAALLVEMKSSLDSVTNASNATSTTSSSNSNGGILEEKKKLLDLWAKRLWKEVDPLLSAALKKRDLVLARKFSAIASMLRNTVVLEKNWLSVRRESLTESWKQLELVSSSGARNVSVDWKAFFSSIAQILGDDFSWFLQLFSVSSEPGRGLDSVNSTQLSYERAVAYKLSVIMVLKDIFPLTLINPKLGELVKDYLTPNSAENYSKSWPVMKETLNFAVSVENAFGKPANRTEQGSNGQGYAIVQSPSNDSFDENALLSIISLQSYHESAKVLFDPFVPIWQSYREWEITYLTAYVLPKLKLNELKSTASSASLKKLTVTAESLKGIFVSCFKEYLLGALVRCFELTYGFGLLEFRMAASKFLANTFQRTAALFQELRTFAKTAISASSNRLPNAPTTSGSPSTSSANKGAASALTEDDICILKTGISILGILEEISNNVLPAFGQELMNQIDLVNSSISKVLILSGDSKSKEVRDLQNWFKQELILSLEDQNVNPRVHSLMFQTYLAKSSWNNADLGKLFIDLAGNKSKDNQFDFFTTEAKSSIVTGSRIGQIFVYDTLFRVLDSHLNQYAKNFLKQVQQSGTSAVALDADIAPTSSMTLMGEYLLALPQYLAQEESETIKYSSLSYSLNTLPYLTIYTASKQETSLDWSQEDPIYVWLRSLAYGTVTRFLECTMIDLPPRSLGTDYSLLLLETDWKYLENILNAMDIEWPAPLAPLLDGWLSPDPKAWLSAKETFSQNLDLVATEEQKKWFVRVQELRGEFNMPSATSS